MNKKNNKASSEQITQSSTAQYLTFVSASGNDPSSIEVRYEDENIWMTQKMMSELYGVSVPAINQHIKKLTEDNDAPRSKLTGYLFNLK